MAYNKTITVSLPDNLLRELDIIAGAQNTSRNEILRKAAALYVRKSRQSLTEIKLAEGYREMASINLSLAEEFIETDNEEIAQYEKTLSK